MGNSESQDEAYVRRRLQQRSDKCGKIFCYSFIGFIVFLILSWLVYINFIYQCANINEKQTHRCSISSLFDITCCVNEQLCNKSDKQNCSKSSVTDTSFSTVFWIALSCGALSFICCICQCTKRFRVSNVRTREYIDDEGNHIKQYQYKYQQD